MKFLLIWLVLISVSVQVDTVDIWPHAPRKWIPGQDKHYDFVPPSENGVHLALVDSDDEAYLTYKNEYYPRKSEKVLLYRHDGQSTARKGALESTVNKKNKLKLTIVAHGARDVEPSSDQYGVKYNIYEKTPQQLANLIKEFTVKEGFTLHERMRFICCNAGSQAASNYMTDFVKEINNIGISIHEIVAYRSYVAAPFKFSVITSNLLGSPTSNVKHVEQIYYYFESKGYCIEEESGILHKLMEEDIIHLSESRADINHMRVLFVLDKNTKEVHRYNYVKTDNNEYEQIESEINLKNDLENFKENLDDLLLQFCPRTNGRRRRRSPSVCGSVTETEYEEEYMIKEKTLAIEDGHIKVELVNRHNPEDTHVVSHPLEETFYMKQVKETAKHSTSLVETGGIQVLERINNALVKYAIFAGFIGAGKFFALNDTIRGAVTLTQSLHGLGEMTKLNQQLSRISKDIFQKGLQKAATELGIEHALTEVTSSVERFGESAAGKFLKAFPFTGMAFQAWFIAEDARALQHFNKSDPNQSKYFGLEVTNLVLDVTTTALLIAEIAFPPAALVLQPIIMALTIARMSISDFYCDVLSELDKLPQDAGDFDKMIAVILGLEEGALDFVTGGLLREKTGLDKEVRQNQELLHNLSKPESYYKITVNDGNVSTLDLMDGILSQYGGFVTVQLLKNGRVTIQVGGVDDGMDGVKTIEKTFYNPSIQNIVLGVGESSKFIYTQKAAHLWWVIPVHHSKVISGEIKLHSSLFGTYYGNDNDNKFIAMQQPVKNPNFEFVIKNYHYAIYGHGGDDTFVLGPQTSVLSGGDGRDFYVFPTSGTHAEIDNFAQDMLEDRMLIKAPFSNIYCSRSHTDLLLFYGPERYRITIKDWFVHSNADHYQHMTFHSADGVGFKIKDNGLRKGMFHTMCVPEILDRSNSNISVSLNLIGKFESVIKVMGSNFSDTIVGNENNNILNGGPGEDMLEGGPGADTYEIFHGQGCDTINNYARDEKVDMVLFQVPFSRIQSNLQDKDLLLVDEEDVGSTCVRLTNWAISRQFQHVAFLSSDHVIFHISLKESEVNMTALMVDLSQDIHGSTVNLSDPYQHLLYVITVFDSAHNDVLIGNVLGNYLSCTGGRDRLQGEGGSDKYVIKAGCKRAYIFNFAEDHISDVLFFEQPFPKLRLMYKWPHIILKVSDSDTEVHLQNWLKGKAFQHLILQTIDGVISMLPSNFSEPEVITPFEISLTDEKCIDHKQIFDLSKDPYRKVEHFQAKSSSCSYHVIGNSQDNYIDPGTGNPMKYQYLMGGNGSDTYVIGHGYGYNNEINNEAKDMKTDHLFLDVLYQDIVVFLEPPHITLSSRSRTDSVHVRLLSYMEGPEHQHLLIKSSDGFFFQVNPLSYPYKSVFSIDTSTSTKSCNISCAEGEEFFKVSQIYGATKFSNYITGSRSNSVLKGGNKDDHLQGNEGNDRIEGNAGDDVIIGNGGDDSLLGGDGDDDIMGGAGNDLIYGGWGADKIDGGPGFDTVVFSGDVRTSTGIKVDLNSGRGEWADAENDTYTGVEAVSGTNFNDLIIGDNEDNELSGKFGNDTIIPGHGSDLLFGGPGNDLYVLDECSGVKRINNFASDKAQDYILLGDFSHNDACFFLLQGNLVISFSYHSPLLSLIQQNHLTVLLDSWNKNDSSYQHVDFVFANDTLVDSSFFDSAEEISPTLYEINSTSPTLSVRTAGETAVQIEVKNLKIEYREHIRFKYYLKVSDELFFSDSLNLKHQILISYSGLLSGVLYTFQLYVSLCEYPLLALSKTTQRTRPTPPTNVDVAHITHSNAFIRWTAPSSDSDPNNSKYTYVVHVKCPADNTITQITTNLTNVEITGLKPGKVYKLSLSSVIEGLKSQEKTLQMKTPNLCPTFTPPTGTRVLDEKMTSSGPVVVIECEDGFQRRSDPEILCLEEHASSPCVPKTCTHEDNVISHGSVVEKKCFTHEIESVCEFGHLSPPIPLCCPKPSTAEMAEPEIYMIYFFSTITVEFYCPHGYWLLGPSRLNCDLRTGEWSQPLLPSCSPITCPEPPEEAHGRFRSLSGKSGYFTEGDVLVLECEADYHPSDGDRIICRNGEWGYANCELNTRLIRTFSRNYKLHGNLQHWNSGSWSNWVNPEYAENLAKLHCETRGLEFVLISHQNFYNIHVECSMARLDTSGREYAGIAEINQGNGWERTCIIDISAAKSFCGVLFSFQEWTVSLRSGFWFNADNTYQCEHSGNCGLQTKSQICTKNIQCRAMCDPYQIPNGNRCDSAFEGEICIVSCNRLYNLQGRKMIKCTSNGWTDHPYCEESGECGYDYETGPHSVGCLTKLWTEVGCNVEANLSPTKSNYWERYNDWTVSGVKRTMATLPDHSEFTYNPDCQVDDCFPGQSTVLMSEGDSKPMSELRVGDKVLAINAHGELVFSEIILWLDRRPSAKERYILLTTEGYSEPLSLSADHVTFIATSNGTAATFATMIPVFAKDIQPGHLIHRYNPATGLLVARRVTDVKDSLDLGAYAPLTVEGNLIVDGHLVSCYALQCYQYFAHLPFAPFRFLHTLRLYVPLFKDLFPVKQEQEDEGIHWYADAWYQVGQWFNYQFGKTCYPKELLLYRYNP